MCKEGTHVVRFGRPFDLVFVADGEVVGGSVDFERCRCDGGEGCEQREECGREVHDADVVCFGRRGKSS